MSLEGPPPEKVPQMRATHEPLHPTPLSTGDGKLVGSVPGAALGGVFPSKGVGVPWAAVGEADLMRFTHLKKLNGKHLE